MINSLKTTLSRNITNALGWKTNRKIVVIESDDWGTIRMASKVAYNTLSSKGYPIMECPYNTNDALESNDDLTALFEVLKSVKGSDGKPAILTANNIVANPDFELIKKSGFQEYYYEPFTDTLKKYPNHDKVMALYKSGIEEGLIMPQFHGREHLNVKRWMQALQNSEQAELDAFEQHVFSPKIAKSKGYVNEYMDALNFDDQSELEFQKKSIKEGLDLFESIWGFRSKSFIAPCYIWHSDLEQTLYENGVHYIQGLVNQFEPKNEKGTSYKKKYHYQGQQNKLGQRYFIRNAFFEPTTNPNFDWTGDCLNRINMAFKHKKPAIISAHRLNFTGHLNPKNREENLKLFKGLLIKITKQWPDVQFLSTDTLGHLYDK
jgi:predicted deacetylase